MKRIITISVLMLIAYTLEALEVDTLWIQPLNESDVQYTSCAVNRDSTIVAFGSEMGYIRLYQIATGDSICCFHADKMIIESLDFSPDGIHLVSGCSSGKAIVWNLQTYLPEHEIYGFTFNKVKYLPDGNSFLVLDVTSYSVSLYNSSTYEKIKSYSHTGDSLNRMCISPDFSKAGVTRTVQTSVWPGKWAHYLDIIDLNKMERIEIIPLSRMVNDLAFSPDGKEIALSEYSYIEFANLDSGKVTKKYIAIDDNIWSVAYSPAGDCIAAGTANLSIADHCGIMFADSKTALEIGRFHYPIPGRPVNDYPSASALTFGKNNIILSGGCLMAAFKVDTFTSVSEPAGYTAVVFPNPATGTVTVLNDRLSNNHFYRIYDSAGNRISDGVEINPFDTGVKIDASSFAPGMYFVRFDGGSTYKFIKE